MTYYRIVFFIYNDEIKLEFEDNYYRPSIKLKNKIVAQTTKTKSVIFAIRKPTFKFKLNGVLLLKVFTRNQKYNLKVTSIHTFMFEFVKLLYF